MEEKNNNSKIIISVLAIFSVGLIIVFSVLGFMLLREDSDQLDGNVTQANEREDKIDSRSNVEDTPIVTEENDQVSPTQINITNPTPETVRQSPYEVGNLTFEISDNVDVLRLGENDNFPLSDRYNEIFLSNPTLEGEVIAITFDQFYLVIATDKSDSSSGGILLDDTDLSNFIEGKTLIDIDGGQFYLTNQVRLISELNSTTSGPAAWSVLSEFFSEKTYESGTFPAYDDIIQRGEYRYIFNLISQNRTELSENELGNVVDTLETIEWN